MWLVRIFCAIGLSAAIGAIGYCGDENETSPGNSTSRFALENDYVRYVIGSVDVQIDDEIIRYGKLSPDGFSNCMRGAYGTVPAAHSAGSTVHHLGRSYGRFLYDADSTILDELAENVLVQGSGYSPFSWHMHVRYASADGHGNIKRYLDQRSPSFAGYRKNLMPLDIGWYPLGSTQFRPDDVEYILCRLYP